MIQKDELVKRFTRNAKKSDVRRISEKLGDMCKGAVKDIWPKVQALYAMVKDPKAAWKSKAMAIGTLLYLITPIDAIPDFIPGAGLSDDAAVILTTVAMLGHELKQYLVRTTEELADVQIRKHNRKLRNTLISLIVCALLAIIVKLLLQTV